MDEDENVDLVSNEEDDLEESIIYRTYRMDFQNKRIIGMIDGLEAAGQGMFKALQTRRYAYEIYDDQYGSDIMNKLGNIDLSPDYLEADMPVMISDAFLNMEEILEIDDLQFEILDVDSIYVSFAASTIFGDTIIEPYKFTYPIAYFLWHERKHFVDGYLRPGRYREMPELRKNEKGA